MIQMISLVFGCSQSNIMIIQISAIAKDIYIYIYVYIYGYIYILVYIYWYIYMYIYMGAYIYGYIFRTWPYIIQVCSKYAHVLSVNIPVLDWQSAVYVLYSKNPHQDAYLGPHMIQTSRNHSASNCAAQNMWRKPHYWANVTVVNCRFMNLGLTLPSGNLLRSYWKWP